MLLVLTDPFDILVSEKMGCIVSGKVSLHSVMLSFHTHVNWP